MRSLPRCTLFLTLSLAAACDPAPGRRDGSVNDGGGPTGADSDGDGITDDWEGAAAGVDTDGDATPDYLDLDSDDDGIDDATEAHTSGPDYEPVDSDSDGVYDFRDLDSDANRIPDADETTGDLDGDGEDDYRDLDDDGDHISDAMEIDDPADPSDFDGDGMPDYRDVDSDGDVIGDQFESVIDTDGDMVLDRFDDDSDDDGWTDAEEAGVADPHLAPVDTDGDGIYDFRDPDSDDDGLSDRRERELGTSRTNADTDGDGVSDLVEIAACRDASCVDDPTDPMSSPLARGDFVFVEPYMDVPTPPRDTLDFATDLRVADVYLLIDTTGSMGDAIMSLQAGLATPTTGLIDRVRAEIPDVWFGVGEIRDYDDPYVYRNVQDITATIGDAQAAVNSLVAAGGGDGPEGDVPALFATATGMGLSGFGVADRTDCPAGTFGWPCFRNGAVPIVVVITDWAFHNDRAGNDPYPGYTDYPTMLAALTAANVRVIGVGRTVDGDLGALADLRAVANDTGAVDATGAPLASPWSGGPISDAVVNNIRILANQTPIDISVQYVDDPTDAVDTQAAFVDHVEANTMGNLVRGCEPRMGVDTNGDGRPDTFRDVTPGTPVCFDIVVKRNDTVMPTLMPQLFRASLRVLGDGFTELDLRDVFFLVPPRIPDPGIE
ncbi:MAG: VWA domain-containing protein [Sandaracinaceae bacterium]